MGLGFQFSGKRDILGWFNTSDWDGEGAGKRYIFGANHLHLRSEKTRVPSFFPSSALKSLTDVGKQINPGFKVVSPHTPTHFLSLGFFPHL